MNLEQDVFLSLLRDHVNQTISAVSEEEINWKTVYEYAKQQSLMGVCYVQIKKLIEAGLSVPADVLNMFHKGFFNDVYVAENHRVYMEELSNAFQEKEIVCLPFKGWVIKDYWPVPELRTMGDVDILVHSEDRESSDSVMESLSYDRFIDNHAVWTYHKKDMAVELHDHMFYEHLVSDIDYVAYFDQAWEHSKPKLDESFHFLYLITHMAKHTINHGMGFRAYMDLVLLCSKAKTGMRWDWIREELTRLKLLRFTETCFAFCRSWFGFEPPLPAGELDPEFYSFVTDKLFQDGIFGLENRQNEASVSAKEIAHTDRSYIAGALKLTLHRIFPPYEEMQLVPWYSFVDGRPWLLPFAWVYRWGYCLIHKQEQSKELLTEPFVKRSVIEERQKLIRDWGL